MKTIFFFLFVAIPSLTFASEAKLTCNFPSSLSSSFGRGEAILSENKLGVWTGHLEFEIIHNKGNNATGSAYVEGRKYTKEGIAYLRLQESSPKEVLYLYYNLSTPEQSFFQRVFRGNFNGPTFGEKAQTSCTLSPF